MPKLARMTKQNVKIENPQPDVTNEPVLQNRFYSEEVANDTAPVVASKPATKSKTIWAAAVTAAGLYGAQIAGEKLGIPAEYIPHVEKAIVTAGLGAIAVIRKYFTNTVLK